MLLKEVSPKLHLFDPKNTVFYVNILYFFCHFYDALHEFSASLLQSSVSSEIIIIFCSFLIIISVENTYFSGFFDESKVQKNSVYLKVSLFLSVLAFCQL